MATITDEVAGMDDREEMKACPFCGSACEERAERGWFACSNNDCPAWHLQALAEDWNRRAPSSSDAAGYSFAERLATLRAETGQTQRELAALTGIAWSMISKYESGQSKPRLKVLMRLADALGVSREGLLGGQKAR